LAHFNGLRPKTWWLILRNPGGEQYPVPAGAGVP